MAKYNNYKSYGYNNNFTKKIKHNDKKKDNQSKKRSRRTTTEVLISVGVAAFIVGAVSWHASQHPRYNSFESTPLKQSKPAKLPKEQALPVIARGTYVADIPIPTQLGKYYKIVSLVHITQYHIYQQLVLLNENITKVQAQKLRNTHHLTKRKSKILRKKINNQPKNMSVNNSNNGMKITLLSAKKPAKRNKSVKVAGSSQKVSSTPIWAQNIVSNNHLQTRLNNMNESVLANKVSQKSEYTYQIKSSMDTRLKDYNTKSLKALMSKQFFNRLFIKPSQKQNLHMKLGHDSFSSNGTTFHKIDDGQVRNLLLQGNVSQFWIGE